jgi:hypothetical protein
MPLVIKSTLKAWKGEISLPNPDEFNRIMWDTWKAAVNKPKRQPYSLVHLYGYAGLEVVQRFGDWNMNITGKNPRPLTLAEVMAWEDEPEIERTKLIAWLARELRLYMDEITDPTD